MFRWVVQIKKFTEGHNGTTKQVPGGIVYTPEG